MTDRDIVELALPAVCETLNDLGLPDAASRLFSARYILTQRMVTLVSEARERVAVLHECWAGGSVGEHWAREAARLAEHEE